MLLLFCGFFKINKLCVFVCFRGPELKFAALERAGHGSPPPPQSEKQRCRGHADLFLESPRHIPPQLPSHILLM